ncbi:MAG TPA: TerC family protein [Nevskiaceae bacterium]|nr:TerC family protein [Nevskiaceae bacterium]
MEALTNPEIWVALFTLAGLEIVLGVDNIIFLTIMANKLPVAQRARARVIGLGGACITRILLLLSLTWLARLTAPLFTLAGNELSGRDLVLIIGGLFLIGKATFEIHEQVEAGQHETADAAIGQAIAGFFSVIVQIMIIDIVFSLDSVITAVGMTQNIPVMVAAIMLAVGVMMFFSAPVGAFVERHPTIKVLALAFLILIGMALVADGLDFHVPKAYLYFAMGFAVIVEMINLRVRRKPPRAH